MAEGPSLLHPARLTVLGSLSPRHYLTTASPPNRTLSGEVALGLHSIFLKALKSLGSEEQIAKWAPLCNKFQIITTYAQTELGHGEPGLLTSCAGCAQFQRAHSQLSGQTLYIFPMKTSQQVAGKGLEGGGTFFYFTQTGCMS